MRTVAAIEFGDWVQVGIDVYIPHHKYQVKLHSSPWFSAACAAELKEISFIVCPNRTTPNIRQESNCCKRILDAAKPAYANKTK